MTLVNDTKDKSTNQALISTYKGIHNLIKNIEAKADDLLMSSDDLAYNKSLAERLKKLEMRANMLISNIRDLTVKVGTER